MLQQDIEWPYIAEDDTHRDSGHFIFQELVSLLLLRLWLLSKCQCVCTALLAAAWSYNSQCIL